MKIYNYDKDSKEFLFVSDAQKNPKQEGDYLFPKYSTTIVPPVLNVYETALFIDGYWKIVSDFRGQKIINLETKEESVCSELGNIPDGFMIYEDYIQTDEYKDYLAKLEKQEIVLKILEEIKSVDDKRIRAICEPSVKDTSTGETWLEFYNKQMVALRQKLKEVEYDS